MIQEATFEESNRLVLKTFMENVNPYGLNNMIRPYPIETGLPSTPVSVTVTLTSVVCSDTEYVALLKFITASKIQINIQL